MNRDAIDVSTFGRRLLDVIVDHAADLGLDLPARRFVHAGELSWDGEELSVALVQVYPGRPGQFTPGPVEDATVMVGEYRVSLVRCVPGPQPSGRPPTGSTLDRAGLGVMGDAGALVRVVLAAVMDETLASWRDKVLVGPLVVDGPGGGLVACSLVVAAQL